MCAAALPGRMGGRLPPETNPSMLAMLQAGAGNSRSKPTIEAQVIQRVFPSHKKRSSQAWDSFEYRAKAPRLAQFDRDASTRNAHSRHIDPQTSLISVGPKSGARKKRPEEAPRTRGREVKHSNGGNDRNGESKEIEVKEGKMAWKAVGKKMKNKQWLGAVRKEFVKKFYAPSMLATKNAKRRKEILESWRTWKGLAAVLDSTEMKAGDQYLAEAKLLHIEAGHEWDTQLDRQLGVCKRAMQRDKGPEVRAKEVRLTSITRETWVREGKGKNEPKRTAWS